MTKGLHDGKLGKLVDCLLDRKLRIPGKPYKVVFLSPPDDPATVRLKKPVVNDLESAGGRTAAFTQNQRYVRITDLEKAQKTSDLCKTAN
jgi:hypothetical protein